jgi:uncharacterized phage protein (TIGR02220 family)
MAFETKNICGSKFLLLCCQSCENIKIYPPEFTKSHNIYSLKRNTGNTTRADLNEQNLIPSVSSHLTPVPEKKNSRAVPAVPTDLEPVVSRVIAKINELAGTAYKPETRTVVNGLVQRLKGGASEADCMTVVEHQWHRWQADEKMREYFNPQTLFREGIFEKYTNAARMSPSSAKGRLYGGGGFVG